jgi:hypothetical protein
MNFKLLLGCESRPHQQCATIPTGYSEMTVEVVQDIQSEVNENERNSKSANRELKDGNNSPNNGSNLLDQTVQFVQKCHHVPLGAGLAVHLR